MSPEVESATRAVERASGVPVVVQADPSLRLIARLLVARNAAPAHVVLFNPKHGEAADYHVISQCGYLLRVYQTPPELRFDVAGSEAGRREVGQLVANHLRRGETNLPPHAIEQLGRQLYDGLILQLRSIPVGMRVDRWVLDAYPTLVGQQCESALRQLAENQAALSPRVRDIAPDRVYDASLGMNAAFAAFWARELGDRTLTVPYKVGGYSAAGGRLLALFDGCPPDPASDRDLIAAWATELGIQGWYAFAPFGG